MPVIYKVTKVETNFLCKKCQKKELQSLEMVIRPLTEAAMQTFSKVFNFAIRKRRRKTSNKRRPWLYFQLRPVPGMM